MRQSTKIQKISRKLFGSDRKETPEQRLDLAIALRQSEDSEIRGYAERLISPDSIRHSAASLAVAMQIPIPRIAQEYEAVQRAHGTIRMARHLPDIMEEVAVKSRSEYITCPVCEGNQTIEVEGAKRICKECRGKGKIDVAGSKDMIKMVFETMKLTGNSGGPLVNVDLRGTDKTEKLDELYKTLEGTP